MLIFITAFIISFLGSVHPGPLNVSVVEATLKSSYKAGLIMAIGGVLPEFVYSLLAAEGILFFERNRTIFVAMQWAMVVILILMGLKTITSKETSIQTKESNTNSFFKGVLLSLFNPQLLVFWLLIVVYFQGTQLLKINDNFQKIYFSIGATLGAFALNYLYLFWANAKKEFIFSKINKQLFNWLIGGSFILMAFLQIFRLNNLT